MKRTAGVIAAAGVCLGLAACVPTPGTVAAVAITQDPTLLDPTGLSGTVKAMNGGSFGAASQPSVSLAQMGVNLEEVAAGRVTGPSAITGPGGAVSGAAALGMMQGAKGAIVAQNTLAGAGAVARGDVFGIAGSVADTSMKMGRMAEAEAAFAQGMARHHAQQAQTQVVPNDDRPSEARALLSIANGGGSASWTNPATGASGTVTLRGAHKGPGGATCRSGTRTHKQGGASRRGDVLICGEGGTWYEIG